MLNRCFALTRRGAKEKATRHARTHANTNTPLPLSVAKTQPSWLRKSPDAEVSAIRWGDGNVRWQPVVAVSPHLSTSDGFLPPWASTFSTNIFDPKTHFKLLCHDGWTQQHMMFPGPAIPHCFVVWSVWRQTLHRSHYFCTPFPRIVRYYEPKRLIMEVWKAPISSQNNQWWGVSQTNVG